MHLDGLLKTVDLFYKLATEHYKVNSSKISGILDMFNQDNDDSEKMEYAIIPIADVEIRPIWSEEKLKIVLRQIQEGLPLEPIMISSYPEKRKPYSIIDGIHRLEASRQLGYHYIPALIQIYQ